MKQDYTIGRLALLTVASTVLALVLFWIFQTYFSDILPLADAKMPPPSWQFQGAYFLTALIFITVAIAFMSILGVIALVGRRYMPARHRDYP